MLPSNRQHDLIQRAKVFCQMKSPYGLACDLRLPVFSDLAQSADWNYNAKQATTTATVASRSAIIECHDQWLISELISSFLLIENTLLFHSVQRPDVQKWTPHRYKAAWSTRFSRDRRKEPCLHRSLFSAAATTRPAHACTLPLSARQHCEEADNTTMSVSLSNTCMMREAFGS